MAGDTLAPCAMWGICWPVTLAPGKPDLGRKDELWADGPSRYAYTSTSPAYSMTSGLYELLGRTARGQLLFRSPPKFVGSGDRRSGIPLGQQPA
ncbi:hypothetical protein GCM10022262_39260 [Georgenia daeguensis]|uniref:Uncharacterized protein n=1 Tax=Georgenia daeguensis TaxID=908355 RepID=A0ABP6UL95_9MICO